ncbi:16S rRNA (guanine(527)-N(7))-methyltransferase RsmG [Halomonas sp. WWR20]
MTPACERLLEAGLEHLDLRVSDSARQQLLALLALLHKWNRAYNLTAVRAPEAMVTKHLLDSASVLGAVSGPRLLDVGAGPGLPGLVLAILKPELQVTLLDSNGKKVRFQRQAVLELGLANVTPVQARVESFEAPAFEQIVSRAFASLGDFVQLTGHLLADQGEWLAMKGRVDDEERMALPDNVEQVECRTLAVPGEAGQRHLLRLKRKH